MNSKSWIFSRGLGAVPLESLSHVDGTAVLLLLLLVQVDLVSFRSVVSSYLVSNILPVLYSSTLYHSVCSVLWRLESYTVVAHVWAHTATELGVTAVVVPGTVVLGTREEEKNETVKDRPI